MRFPAMVIVGLAVTLSAVAQGAEPVIQVMAANEKLTLSVLEKYAPMVETYLQIVSKSSAAPIEDYYYLHRINVGSAISETQYDPASQHILPASAFLLLVRHAPVKFRPSSFVCMLSPDIHGLNPDKYRFVYSHKEFLGELRTVVYDVQPKQPGYFRGRIWITEDGHLVRFMGTFSTDDGPRPPYAHFDSWRVYVPAVGWVPATTYIEEPLPEGTLHGQIRIWGYDMSRHAANSSVSMQINNAIDHTGADVSPGQALDQWRELATQNVLERLETAGLLAPPSEIDAILDQIITNLQVPSGVAWKEPIHCRILLTAPITATSIGNTILVSRGLLETVPDEGALAAVLANELAQIAQGKPMDTRWSFADRLMFSDRVIFRKLSFAHSPREAASSAALAAELMDKSIYHGTFAPSVYYEQMRHRAKGLKSLFHPPIGDSVLSTSGVQQAVPREVQQRVTARPLGSNIVVDTWSGEVRLRDTREVEMDYPFAVMPIFEWLRPVSNMAQNQ
ncbi:MAG: hypothetical protein IRZ03_13105 [Acidobacterium ailaaui]|jgi:hypothetical protein|nr:hypothetical protein [Pseudacidobacterium ailaaui]